jgi:peptidoglycan/LPS O-acetylase OafA/YrhL
VDVGGGARGGTTSTGAVEHPIELTAETPAEVPAEVAAHRRLGFGYQPALDGFRALAVLAVMAYHGNQAWAKGGFLGVDAFFVLSGYLITSLLLAESFRSGRIDLKGFYVRRARRLLPALLLVLGVVVGFGGLLWSGDQLLNLRGDVFGALGYYSNWKFLFSGQSYFAAASPSPLRHLWSLAIEEQWYFIWPAVLFVLLRSRVTLRGILVVTLALMTTSVVLMAVMFRPEHDPGRVYYGTDTRAQSLLVGAALAIILVARGPIRSWVTRAGLQVVGIFAAGYVLWRWSVTREISTPLYRGGFFLSAVAVAVVIVAAVQPTGALNPLRTVLSITPLRWIGMISYGLYLWHWPIYLTVSTSRTGLEGTTLFVVRVLLTFAVAIASYFLVERPVRRGNFSAKVAWAGGLTAVTVVIVLLFVVTDGAVSQVPTNLSATSAGLSSGPAPPTLPADAATPTPGAEPTIAQDIAASGNFTVPTDGHDDSPRLGSAGAADTHLVSADVLPPDYRRVLYAGDSVMWSLGLGMTPDIAHRLHVAVGNTGVYECGLTEGPARGKNGFVRTPGTGFGCDWPDQWPEYVSRFRPDVTVLMPAAWEVLDRQVGGQWLDFGTPAADRYLRDQIKKAVAVLTAQGGKVVFMSSPPFAVDPMADDYTPWTSDDAWRVAHVNDVVAKTVKGMPNVAQLDFASYYCPNGSCGDSRWDGVHFQRAAAAQLDEWLLPRVLAAAGVPSSVPTTTTTTQGRTGRP